MKWNWQHESWPNFSWDQSELEQLESRHLRQSGMMIGSIRHFNADDRNRLVVELITDEAVKTSEIEGEFLDRDSVQSSILRNFGLLADLRRVRPAERGIADMLTDLYSRFDQPLSHQMLFDWHSMLMSGRRDLQAVGQYRTHEEPMQVVSGRIDQPKIHFEAPPSRNIRTEMDAFMVWWHRTAPDGTAPLPSLTRAGIAHLYFVCIHPFEDGNGRIGRALAEKSLAEHHGEPTLTALSQTIEKGRKTYYDKLEKNNKGIEITDWLVYFAQTILEAQTRSLKLVDFLIGKARLYDRLRGQINMRQQKVLERMFREGLSGFKGGLSAENYISITGTSRATATRDLAKLVELGALVRTGELKSTRYWLKVGWEQTQTD